MLTSEGIKLPKVWLDELAKGTNFGKRVETAIPNKPVTVPKTKSKIAPAIRVSDVGDRLREILVEETGAKITCGTCLAYLKSLNYTTKHDHDKLVQKLLAEVPFPNWWRSKYNRLEKRDRVSELINQVIPKPSVDFMVNSVIKHKVGFLSGRDWAVVVTTSPRTEPTIEKTLTSLRNAGWEPTVFAEPESYKPEHFKYVNNSVRLGAWHNWLQSVRWALENTTSNHILSVQDDSLFHPDSRFVVEQLMYPTNKTGFISLYTASHYTTDRGGKNRPVGVNKIMTSSFWGACALVFPREALQQILNHPIVEGWTGIAPSSLSDKGKRELLERKKKEPYLIQNVDTAIGKIVNSLHLEMYVVDPSPVKHIAKFSSIGHGNDTGKRNCSRCADHNLPLINQVFPQ